MNWLCIFVSLFVIPVNGKCEWKNIVSIEDLTKECLEVKTVLSENELVKENKFLVNEMKLKNNEWDNKYFAQIAKIQDIDIKKKQYLALKVKIKQLKGIIEQYDSYLESIEEIYRNRLKAIPTAYLLLVQKKGDLTKSSRDDIDKELERLAKQFAGANLSQTYIDSYSKIKNSILVKQNLLSIRAGRVESYEGDPVRQMSASETFYSLQIYKIYPKFNYMHNGIGLQNSVKTHHDAWVITNSDNEFIPNDFKVGDRMSRLDNMLNEVIEFNRIKNKQIIKIDLEYNNVVNDIYLKKRESEQKLKEVMDTLNVDFRDLSQSILERSLEDAKISLERHLELREYILTTVRSEFLQQSNQLDELFSNMVVEAYNELLARASQLTSFRFFMIIDGHLESINAKDYYSKPFPIAFTIPVKRKKFIKEGGGSYRCSVVLGLKVKFTPRSNYTKREDLKDRAVSWSPHQLSPKSLPPTRKSDLDGNFGPSQKATRKKNKIPGEYPITSEKCLNIEELKDLTGLDPWKLSIMRNEIFARHGYKFHKNDKIEKHFNNQNWYRNIPESGNSNIVYSNMSQGEKCNIKLIQQYEK
jgi:hypothetical protein